MTDTNRTRRIPDRIELLRRRWNTWQDACYQAWSDGQARRTALQSGQPLDEVTQALRLWAKLC